MKKTIVLAIITLLAVMDLFFTLYAIKELSDINNRSSANLAMELVNNNDAHSYEEDGLATNTTDTNTIAVVNLDEGIDYNGQFVVYSSQIIQFPENNCTYEYTSLSDAEIGLSDGRYGAYIVIPATFSESITSINTTPEPCNLDYYIEESSSDQTDLIRGIYDFYISLNNRISYMYLANILNDFHTAQDNATIVIQNDITDYNAMMAVQPTDITNAIVLSETPLPTNTMSPLDVTNCWQVMSASVNNINAQYANVTNDINENIDAINVANTELQSILTGFRSNLNDFESGVYSIPGLTEITYLQQQDIIASTVDELGPENAMQLIVDLDNDLSLFEECLVPSVENYLYSDIEYLDETPMVEATIDLPEDEEHELVLRIGDYYCFASVEEHTVSIDLSDLQGFVNEINNACENSDVSDSSSAGESINLQNIDLIDSEGNHIVSEVNGVTTNMTMGDLLTEMDSIVTTIDPEIFDNQALAIYSAYISNVQGLVDNINSQVTDINGQIDSVRNNICSNINGSLASVDAYTTVLRNNRLSFSGDIASADLNNLGNAVYYLQQAVNDNNNSYITFASDLQLAETNNLSILRQNILDAYNLSQQSVEDGLSNAINVRGQTSAQNQLLMNDFIGMLPYTRLGTLENTTAYQFIASPVTLNNASD